MSTHTPMHGMDVYADKGGPAAPLTFNDGKTSTHYYGMSLRDYFAAKACIALLDLCRNDSHEGVPYLDHVAMNAYEMADAMLKARES